MKPLLLIYFHVFPCPGGSFVPCLSDSIESNGGVLWSGRLETVVYMGRLGMHANKIHGFICEHEGKTVEYEE